MRKEFAKFIAEIVKVDNKIHLITLDTGQNLFDQLIKENPRHYWNFGVTEQASVGIASGMALQGLKPYLYSITPFILERPFEQIKLDLVEQNANVKLIGYWDYPHDGPTHKTKDVRGLCKILGIKLYEPKNSKETREILLETYNINKPIFFSLTKDKF